eukprot:scaffold280950_cov30-Tisochrysis_lutea.AAC.2
MAASLVDAIRSNVSLPSDGPEAASCSRRRRSSRPGSRARAPSAKRAGMYAAWMAALSCCKLPPSDPMPTGTSCIPSMSSVPRMRSARSNAGASVETMPRRSIWSHITR